MANVIKPKRSESTGQTPTLSPGELAVNIADKKVWVANSSGTPVLIVDGNASISETDPVFSASAAFSITTTDVTNWNMAYGWGDHASAGYLTTETDPVFSASTAASITATDISTWNAKPDTVTVTSTGSTITVTNNTVGGAISFNVETPQGIATTDSPTFAGLTAAGLVYPTTDGTSGQVIVTDGAGNLSFATVGGGASALDDLTDVTITTVANDNILRYNGTSSQWENVNIDTNAITEGNVNLYFTDARARAAISAGTGISFNSTTGVITNSSPDQTVVLTAGTGISTSGTYPSFTITNTAPDQTVKLTAGTGISTSGTYPNFTITNSSPDQTVTLTAGSNISITGTYPSFTISASGGGSGTVTSITGGSYLTGGTITTTGTLAVDATSANTASKVVARDASGNFSAGVITASSINKVAITAPATSATITVADGKTLTVSNTLTFTGTDASSVAFGTGGTVLYSGGALGTPSSGTLTNCTFPTLNQNTTGSSGSCTGNSATATKSTNIIGGNSTTLLGSIPYQSNTDTTSLLSPNTTTTKKFLRQTGTGTNGAAPAWDTVTASDVGLGNVSNTAQVTSVTGTSPVTSSGGTTPAISLASGYGDTQNPYASKTANYVLAAPNGLAGVPTFRALVAADIPTLNQNTTGTAAGLSATLAIASGGTGQTTQQAAINALTGTQSAGKYLRSDGTNATLATIQAADIPTLNQSTTGNAATATKTTNIIGGNGTTLLGSIPYQSGTDATSLLAPNTTATKNFLSQTGTGVNGAAPSWSAITKTDIGLANVENTALSTWAGSTNITTVGTISSGTWSGGTISMAKGGTGNPLTATAGAVAFSSSTGIALTSVGTSGQMLQCNATSSPVWVDQSTLNAGTATTATNLANGGAGQIPYNTGSGATAFLAAGTSGQVLRCNGASAPSWESQGIFSSGRLTLETGVPISTTDKTNQSFLYFTPYDGNKISLYDGSNWATYTFNELSKNTTGLVANTNYDVFVYNNAGTLVIETTAWTNDTTRATSLVLTNGVYLKSGSLTRRYVGTIRANSSGLYEDSKAYRFVWNFNNKVLRSLYVGLYIGLNHTYNGNAREWNNGTNVTRLQFITGIDGETFIANGVASITSGGFACNAYFGVDSTTAQFGATTTDDRAAVFTRRSLTTFGQINSGYHYMTMIQSTESAGTSTFLDVTVGGALMC